MNATADITSNDRLGFTFFLALALHTGVYFGVDFDVDKGNKIAPMLNVTLATHQSSKNPDKADFIAQFDQQASGSGDEVRELSAKEVALIEDVKIRDVSELPKTKAQQQADSKKQYIQTLNPSERKVLQEELESFEDKKEQRDGDEMEIILDSTEYASLQAKLDRIKQEIANQPRIRRLTSVSTRKSYDAKYLHDWAQKVELVGNENFPQLALRDEIFGSLRMSVLILPNGFVEKVEILQSSGHSILDEAAKHIIKLSSPFQPFPREIRKETDKIEIIRTWRFEITGLKTTR